jgi:hypothetical protein
MALSITQRGTQSATSTTVTATLGASPAAGSLILVSCAIYNYNFPVNPVVADSAAQSYTLVQAPSVNSGLMGALFFYFKNTASGVTTVTLTVDVADYLRIHIYEVVGADTSSPVDTNHVTSTDANTSTGTISVTTSTAATAVFGNFSGSTTATTSAGSGGWTLGYSDDSVAVQPITLSDVYQIVASANTYSPNVTWVPGQSAGYSTAAVAIKEAAGGTTNVERAAADTVSLSDLLALILGLLVPNSDSVALTDSFVNNLAGFFNINDTINLVDDNGNSLGVLLGLNDQVSLTDALATFAAYGLPLSDVVSISDALFPNLYYLINFSDTLSLSEAAAYTLNNLTLQKIPYHLLVRGLKGTLN